MTRDENEAYWIQDTLSDYEVLNGGGLASVARLPRHSREVLGVIKRSTLHSRLKKLEVALAPCTPLSAAFNALNMQRSDTTLDERRELFIQEHLQRQLFVYDKYDEVLKLERTGFWIIASSYGALS